MHLTIVEPPSVEPVSVAEFRRDRRLDALEEDDTESPEYLDSLGAIQAARGYVESYTRRALITQTLRVDVRGRWVAAPVRLFRPPLIAIVTVEVDGVEVDASAYDFDAGAGHVWPLNGGINSYPQQWITTAGYPTRVSVTYTAGYGATAADVPAVLRQAVLRVAGDLFENREDGVVGHSVGEVPLTTRMLLDPWKVVHI